MSDDPLQLPRKPWSGLELEVEIERLTDKGLGACALQLEIGPQRLRRDYEVEVRGALPGERVRALIARRRRRALEARLVEILRPSPGRVEPRCRHFGPLDGAGHGCGGCTLQSLAYSEQLEAKQALVARLLDRAGVDAALVEEPIGAESGSGIWRYRNKMELSFARSSPSPGAAVDLGLHPPGYRWEVLSLEECRLISAESASLIPLARRWANELQLDAYRHVDDRGFLRTLTLREGKRSGERMVELTTSAEDPVSTARGSLSARAVAEGFAAAVREAAGEGRDGVSSIYWTVQRAVRGQPTRFDSALIRGAPALREELQLRERRLRFEIHPRAFFQPNSLQAELLYGLVVEAIERGGGGSAVLDLYCGTGTIALCLAPAFERVIGVELHAGAVESARRNALFNGIDNVRFVAGDVARALDSERGLGGVDAAVVDPPRSGLLPAAIEQINRTGAQRLVYVSCNPRALARDLIALRRYGFEARAIRPVDMFPHTGHVECVALLER